MESIIIADTLSGLGTDRYEDYLGHALCIGGSCRFVFNGEEKTLSERDLLIVRKGKLMDRIEPDADFRVMVVYVTSAFINLSTPQANYGTKGQLALFLNPIMHLTEEQYRLCYNDLETLRMRLAQTEHHFYGDLMINTVQTLILDFFDFHSCLYQEYDISSQYASIMNRFLSLLENGEFRTHREVTWYADKLCVTAKYLSEVSKKVSGYPANFWINRYTSVEISRLLRDKSLSFVAISDKLGFSSPAYFSRYVTHNLGLNPTDYRDR